MDDIFSKLKFSEELCYICGANLWPAESGMLICLNACHLSESTRAKFAQIMDSTQKNLAQKRKSNNEH